MGTWGPAIFSDDLAADVKEDFKLKIGLQKSNDTATQEIINEYQESINDPEEHTVFWLALATIQWDLGRSNPLVNKKALQIIESGDDLKRWEGSNDYNKRNVVLTKLHNKLVSNPPPEKKVKKPYIQSTPFEKGQIISLQLKNGKYCLIGIVDIKKQYQGDTYPLAELYDYYSDQDPTNQEIQKLKTKRIAEAITHGGLTIQSSQQFLILSSGVRDTTPMKRIKILKDETAKKINPGTQKTWFWKTIEKEIIDIFELNAP